MSQHVLPARKLAAWSVHMLTAFGAVFGLMAMFATANERWMAALAWMAVTIAIDSFDGTLARLVKVKEVLPGFDGTLLDNIVDYFTFVIVPAFFLYETHILPPGFALLGAAAITLASGYQFCQADAKTEDHFFKGFPSYWNVVVFYLFLMPWPRFFNFVIILTLAVAVFVPVKYLYPSRTEILRVPTLVLTLIWGVLLLVVFFVYPDASYIWYLYASFAYVVYYFAVSIYLTLKRM